MAHKPPVTEVPPVPPQRSGEQPQSRLPPARTDMTK